MFRFERIFTRSSCLIFAISVLVSAGMPDPTTAQEVVVTLKDGRQYEGRLSGLSGYSPTPSALLIPGETFPVAMVDDGLRRIFFNAYRRAAREVPLERSVESFEIWQDPIFKTNKGFGVGPVLHRSPFDTYGRRTITLLGSDGARTQYVQGITEITPDYVKVVGLQTKGKNRYFDMRFATNSIPSSIIVDLLHRQIKDPDNSLERERLINFFVAAEMYEVADRELKAYAEKFPGLSKEVDEKRKKLQLEIHRRALNEIRFRFEAGQVQLANDMWEAYPNKRSMPAEIGAEFADLKDTMTNQAGEVERVRNALIASLDKAANSEDFEAAQKKILLGFKTEIESELNFANVERLATYARFVGDKTQSLKQILAYAISGWYVGSANAIDNFAVAQSFPQTRRLVRQYLKDADAAKRESILNELKQIETGTPESIARIIGYMLPTHPPTEAAAPGKPYKFSVKIAAPRGGEEEIDYFVQLPPAYNPHKKYPCVVTLPTVGFDPEVQLQWWTGQFLPNMNIHSGPASRHGYIVISPRWWPKRGEYQYSVREHDAVLSSFRDALKRFSIDTDKVFLSGHFKGGDAAWDIGLSHPDLWAGVIPISARPDKYILHYFETAHHGVIPFYIVMGGKDFGVRSSTHTTTLDRWLRNSTSNVDVTLIEYQGRGGENFFEESGEIFKWMKIKKRLWVPTEFNGRSLRSTDNFFWNLEVGKIPSANVVPPIVWDSLKHDTFKMGVTQKGENVFHVSPFRIGEDVSLWLGPEFADFSKNVRITGRGSAFNKSVTPSRRVILEDVRTRGDRQHPFWARLFCAKSRWEEKE